jgi:hypothetical protein
MADLARSRVDRANRGPIAEVAPRHHRADPEILREIMMALGLWAVLTGAGFAAIYFGGNYMAYLLGVE